MDRTDFDLAVIGAGINGAGIARDAAGRGLRVLLCDQGDIAGATSSASSKLIHGGLRYLEHGDLRLVREALRERAILLRIAPHLVRPLQFFLPLGPRSRARWKLRAGLALYDWLAGDRRLKGSAWLELSHSADGALLKPEFRRGLCYWDAWGDDARLVLANARDAEQRGAAILTRTRCARVARSGRGWMLELQSADAQSTAGFARAVINATGPWADRFLHECASIRSRGSLRLVKGSHIVLRRSLPVDRALILQNEDRRVVFVLPFETDFTLIGTTDVPFTGDPGQVSISDDEIQYLCRAASRYLSQPVSAEQVVWTYSGVRGLYDDRRPSPSAVTRDYTLQLECAENGAPLLSVFGGKLTTYRKLAEQAVDKLAPLLNMARGSWTATHALPGGDLGGVDFESWSRTLVDRYPSLPPEWVRAIARRHGSLATHVLADAHTEDDLGIHFGAGLTAREIDYLIECEWAQDPQDILWRRSKLGLRLSPNSRRP